MPDTLVAIAAVAALLIAVFTLLLLLNTRDPALRVVGTRLGSAQPLAGVNDPALDGVAGRSAPTTSAPASHPSGRLDADGPFTSDDSPRTDPLLDETLRDPATRLMTPLGWNMVIEREDNRFGRYGHPTTIIVIEMDGLDGLQAALGQKAADRLILPVATTLRMNARSADTIARIGYSRFLLLLPETDEIAAIGYIDRVRTACDTWLEAGEVSVRLAVGWAQAVTGSHLVDAMGVAEKRMHADRRRGRRAAADAASAQGEATEQADETSNPVI